MVLVAGLRIGWRLQWVRVLGNNISGVRIMLRRCRFGRLFRRILRRGQQWLRIIPMFLNFWLVGWRRLLRRLGVFNFDLMILVGVVVLATLAQQLGDVG